MLAQKTPEILDSQQRQEDMDNWTGNWIWRAVHTLVESPECSASPKWIASKLEISVEKAVDALEGLVRLSIIEMRDGRYHSKSSWLQTTTQNASREELLIQFSRIAPQIISRLNTVTSKFTYQFFLADAELIARYTPKIMEIYNEMNEEGLRRGLTDVYASEIAFAKMSSTSTQAGGNK